MLVCCCCCLRYKFCDAPFQFLSGDFFIRFQFPLLALCVCFFVFFLCWNEFLRWHAQMRMSRFHSSEKEWSTTNNEICALELDFLLFIISFDMPFFIKGFCVYRVNDFEINKQHAVQHETIKMSEVEKEAGERKGRARASQSAGLTAFTRRLAAEKHQFGKPTHHSWKQLKCLYAEK